eukprot:212741_1
MATTLLCISHPRFHATTCSPNYHDRSRPDRKRSNSITLNAKLLSQTFNVNAMKFSPRKVNRRYGKQRTVKVCRRSKPKGKGKRKRHASKLNQTTIDLKSGDMKRNKKNKKKIVLLQPTTSYDARRGRRGRDKGMEP